MRVAILGRPGSGKTTLFRALGGDRPRVPHAPTDAGAVVSVDLPDPRLEWLRDLQKPKKFTPVRLEFADLPGLPRAAARGRPELFAAMRAADGLLLVVRAFRTDAYAYETPEPDPAGEARSVREDLRLADYEVLAGRVERLEAQRGKPGKFRESEERELALLERLRRGFEGEGKDMGALVHGKEEDALLRSFAFLTIKPFFVLANTAEGLGPDDAGVAAVRRDRPDAIALCLELEEEIAALDLGDREAFLRDYGLPGDAKSVVVPAVHAAMGLCSFFTIDGDEVRAWTIPAGATALEAAGRIHTDLARGFVRAEVTPFEELRAAGSWREAKALGKTRVEGKDSVVRDGDVVHVRFSV